MIKISIQPIERKVFLNCSKYFSKDFFLIFSKGLKLTVFSIIMTTRVKDAYDVLAKLIIIGDSGVGKTNLILNFVN